MAGTPRRTGLGWFGAALAVVGALLLVVAVLVRLNYLFGALSAVLLAAGFLTLAIFLNRPENKTFFGTRSNAGERPADRAAAFYVRRIGPIVAIVLGVLGACIGFVRASAGVGFVALAVVSCLLVALGVIILVIYQRRVPPGDAGSQG